MEGKKNFEIYSKFVILTVGLDILISIMLNKGEKNLRAHLSLHLEAIKKVSIPSKFKGERATKLYIFCVCVMTSHDSYLGTLLVDETCSLIVAESKDG